jgi:Double zinc ribbon
MNCPECGANLIEEAQFCNKCGASVPEALVAENAATSSMGPTCATCGSPLAENAKFCATCGTVVASAQSIPAEEITQVAATSSAAAYAGPDATTRGVDSPGASFGEAPPRRVAPYGQPAAIGNDWVTEAARRFQRIFKFDASVYAELRSDPQATTFSLVAAALGMFAFGLGGFLWTAIEWDGSGEMFWKSALIGTLIGLAFWAIGLVVSVGVLAYAFRQTVRFDEMLRVAGAATATLSVGFFMLIPGIGFGVALLAVVFWVMATVFAMQSAFGIEQRQAVAASLAGFAVWAVILPLIVSKDNPIGPGIFLFDWTNDVLANSFHSLKYILP